MTDTKRIDYLADADAFIHRHIGANEKAIETMLAHFKENSLSEFVAATVPSDIQHESTSVLPGPVSEEDALAELAILAEENTVNKSYIGLGYHPCYTPAVIQRNVLENPGWYTAYTPYQPEIAQGRLEGLFHFQTMISDLTGLPLANGSMLDEATAVAEAMSMAKRVNRRNKSSTVLVDEQLFPQTLAVLETRAEHFNFTLRAVNFSNDLNAEISAQDAFAVVVQNPARNGALHDIKAISDAAKKIGALTIVAADIMSLVLLKTPGSLGADIVVGSNQRFGIPMGFGGPHAAFFAFKDEHKRSAPGRIIGMSKDRRDKPALRMAMQTREQHIRREKANSNICTSQVLLALMSVFYAMYHGRDGVRRIADRIHRYTGMLASGLEQAGLTRLNDSFFDTVSIDVQDRQRALVDRCEKAGINVRCEQDTAIAISLNECTEIEDIKTLLDIFSNESFAFDKESLFAQAPEGISASQTRSEDDAALTHDIFNTYHSETQMLRYLKKLESRDLALNQSMIPLGSCTMKLNATSEMVPVTWPKFSAIHPFAPLSQAKGYIKVFEQLENMLKAATGYDAISLQPNAGSQGEYAGLVAIKNYFKAKGETQREICLIPSSAHGTNPASAQMAGFEVVVTRCDEHGNVSLADLENRVQEYGDRIAALMVTYPSTHGVFEEDIRKICDAMHRVGAQVYVDGANMNALVGVAAPGEFGGDVSHLNLHKTFCIPHGGGGPGMGPIGVKSHLAPHRATHPLQNIPDIDHKSGTISAAPWGSASILLISWMYIRMMGGSGLRKATQVAILSANYIAERLDTHYPILYKGVNGRIAHECLIDLRPIKEASGISEEDIAKRLMDYGFHAPTMSFPVAGTLMIEPTESEDLEELDRFCDAMIAIRNEIEQVESGEWPADDNPLVNAPHTLADVLEEWTHPYSRKTAAQPLPYLEHHKFWPYVNRIDNVYGDRNLVCTACM